MLHKGVRRLWGRVFRTVLAAYAGIVLYYFIVQDSILFHPKENRFGLNYYLDKGFLDGVQEVRIETLDGQSLEAWYRKPDSGKPMFLYLHGNAGGLDARILNFRALNEAGCGFFAPAWRGFSSSSGVPSRQGFMIDAQASLWALRQRGYRLEDLFLVGESLGTGVATVLAAQHRFAGLLLLTPYTSILDRASELHPYIPFRLIAQRNNFDNISHIQKVRCPVFFVHGTADRLMPYVHSQRLYDQAKEPKFIKIYEGIGHTGYDMRDILRLFLDFVST